MAQKSLKYYYAKAKKEGWAMVQCNFSSASQLRGIVQAAVNLKSPLLLGTSEGDARFFGTKEAVALVKAYREKTKLPIFLNFDHGKSFESINEAAKAGYDALHFDGSKYSFKENIAIAKKVIAIAKKYKISVVEGEFAEIPGEHSVLHKGKAPLLDKSSFTDPIKAKEFVQKTGINALAILIGTVHGVYKKNPRLDLERLQEIRKHVICSLVLHGGSGTPKKDMLAAIKLGVTKVNISTDLRSAFTNTLRKSLKEQPNEIMPSKILSPSDEAVRKIVEEKIKFFGSVNKI